MSSPKKKSSEKKLKDEDVKTKKKHIIKKDQKVEERKFGESLSTCSDVEWDKADPAYASELINVKKKANKVTVFAGPGAKTIERTIIRTDTLSESLDENADAIGRMASAIAHIFLSDKKIPSVNVSINLEESSNESQAAKAS
ncbi:Uncharacterized protein BM_BM1918 [Brugia malayi]|uniref:Bm1918 n=1 Tax=Brugia malayi TaxID=6279 RepID=A0A0K0J3P8_BRUMA|nr:Uncharacterized protein BM_BM1918 [Brugia malayi]CDP95115.1 Bm1918 [Brugia malayi]VIO92678.1 Uncharacterized protein BM_BM1918 [Brugia malayi]